MNHVAIYARASTTEERQNLDIQVNPLVRWCEERGHTYTVYKEFASGSKQSRPQLNIMMQDVRARKCNTVLVWRLDRLGRSIQHLLQLIEEFKNKDVAFISFHEGFDTNTPHGKLFFHIAAAFAQFERELTMERVNLGLTEAKRKGKKLGRPKGSKDKKRRRKSGYHLRWARQGKGG